MTRIVHTPSPKSVSTSPDILKTKFSLKKRSIDIQLMEDAQLINCKTLSRKCGKDFTNRYELKSNYSYTSWSILYKQKHNSKIYSVVIKAFHNWFLKHENVK